jgi:hypothetical protein
VVIPECASSGNVISKDSSGLWRLGFWDPESNHASLPTKDLKEAWPWAQKKADNAFFHTEAATAKAITAARASARSGAGRAQRPFVVIPESDRGELRRWSVEPIALPPYPCMLCDAAFAERAEFDRHIVVHHHGWREYRKRLFYLVFSALRLC